MAGDRDIVRGSLDTGVGLASHAPDGRARTGDRSADYVLIAEIIEVERFEQQGSENVERLANDLEHLVSSRGMLVVRTVL